MKTFLTRRGYQIDKLTISDEEKKKIEETLTIVLKNQFDKSKKISASYYREGDKYVILPRFIGEKLYGPAKNIMKHENSKMTFNGVLRDVQKPIIEKTIKHLTEKKGGILSLGCGGGKCFARGTKILMYDGKIKNVEDIIIGDVIMGDDSTKRNVISLGSGYDEMFDIYDDNGNFYTVNSEHILSLKVIKDFDIYKVGDIVDFELKNYLQFKDYLYGYRVAVNFEKKEITNKNFIINNRINDEYLYNSKNIRDELLNYLISINYDNNIISFISRTLGYEFKNNVLNKNPDLNYKITIKKNNYDKYYGFEIDGNRRFLLHDCSVTHNTVLSLYTACHFKAKTLVIVAKSFLLDQWVARIKQFTSAKIGIIRQNIVKVEGYDIVVGMAQSIGMRDYDLDIFSKFKMVIIDEAHHFASSVFSHVLNKAGAPYILGLSATPVRIDGLTPALNWYMGDIIYRQKIKINRHAIVKIFRYESTDELFKEEFVKLRHATQISNPKMLNNIVKIKSRNDHIINIINELRRFPERKILILTKLVEHAKFLKQEIDKLIELDIKNGKIFADEYKTFLYIGKMNKHLRRQAEESGDIIFGTYDMAQEGLDIDRLNTLVFATPKKDIIQAVGRVMRKILKMGDVRPLIIDFHDDLSIFNSQMDVRKKQYKNNKYEIEKYYIKDDKILTLKEYKQNNEIDNIDKEYIPTYESILNLQKVQEMDRELMENAEVIEIDPNDNSYLDEDDELITSKNDVSGEYLF